MTSTNNPYIAPEILFSSWAFIWVILYCIILTVVNNPILRHFIQTYANPLVSIFVALLFQILALIAILCYSVPQKIPIILLKLLILTLVFKLGPFLLVHQFTTRSPISFGASIVPFILEPDANIWKESALSFAVAFSIYLVYILSRGLNLFSIYIDLLFSIVKDDDRVPPYYWSNQIIKQIYKNQ